MIATAVRRAPSRALEGLAWVGLVASLLLIASAVSLPRPAPEPAAVALVAMTPDQFSAWVQAIVGAIGAVSAALNGLAILWHRWGKPPRKRHRDTPPGPAPHTGPGGA